MGKTTEYSAPLSEEAAVRLRRHKEDKEPTLKVLRQIHQEFRNAVMDGADLVDNLQARLATKEDRRDICNWLRLHECTECYRQVACEGGSISDITRDWPAKDRDWLTGELNDWLNGKQGTGLNNLLCRCNLLRWFRKSWLESQPFCFDLNHARVFLAASLGVVFMHFSPALRQLYYHWLLCDLLPEKTRLDVMETLAVPEGAGTVGWITREAISQAGAQSAAVALWSCMADPKGRVTTEDLAIGNRSFVAVPLFLDNQPVGVVFCFLPIDGLFIREPEGTTPLADVASVRNTAFRTVRFVDFFKESVLRYKNELLMALRAEEFASLYEVSRQHVVARHAQGYSFGKTPREDDQSRQAERLRHALVPPRASPGDPLGFLLAIRLEEQVEPTTRQRSLHNIVLLREDRLCNHILQDLQQSCFCAVQQALPNVTLLEALRRVLVGADAPPTWHFRDEQGWHFLDDDGVLRKFYPEGSLGSCHRIRRPFVEERARLATQFAIADHALLGLPEVLDLHSPVSHALDLVVPFMCGTSRSEPCMGFLRIKCHTQTPVRAMDANEAKNFQRLYALFNEDFADVRGEVGKLLWHFENALRNATSFDRVKALVDQRIVICDAIAAELMSALQAGHATTPRLDLVRVAVHLHAMEEEGVSQANDSILSAVDRCSQALKVFCATVREQARDARIPEAAFVVMWLAGERPILTHEESNGIAFDARQLLSSDPGFKEMVELLIRRTRVSGSSETLRFDDRHLYVGTGSGPASSRASPVLVLPPVFAPSEGADKLFSEIEVGGPEKDAGTACLRLRGSSGRYLQLTFAWNRFPEPVSMHYRSGCMEDLLCRQMSKVPNLDPRKDGLHGKLGAVHRRHSLDEVIVSRKPTVPTDGFLQGLDQLAGVMAGRNAGLQSAEPAPWRVVSLSGGARVGLLLAFARADESAMLARIRDAAVLGVQAAFLQSLHDAELLLAQERNSRIDFTRHLVGTTFGLCRFFFERACRALGKVPSDERIVSARRDMDLVGNQYDHLQCLWDCLTDDETKLAELSDLTSMLTNLMKWYAGDQGIQGKPSFPSVSPRYPVATARRLFLLFANLFDNAQRHATRVRVRLDETVNVRYKTDKEFVVVTVENSGQPMERKEEWTQFLMVAEAVAPPVVGCRGLAHVKSIAWALEVKLCAPESPAPALGEGTAITVRIPRVLESREA